MEPSPFQAAAIGLLIVAGGTLSIHVNDRAARAVYRRGDAARQAFRARCRDYTAWLLVGAVVLALLSRAF